MSVLNFKKKKKDDKINKSIKKELKKLEKRINEIKNYEYRNQFKT